MSDGTVLLGKKSAFADKKQNMKNCVSAGFFSGKSTGGGMLQGEKRPKLWMAMQS
jgi:hypothetical protein